jgi:hypothetical protein
MVVMTDKEFVVRLSVILADIIPAKEMAGDLVTRICLGFGFGPERQKEIQNMTHAETVEIGKKVLEELTHGK